MPIEVQSAYRDPIDLLGLLATDVYSPADRIAVRDALLSSLLARYGDAWVEVGGKEVRVTTHVKSFRKNIVGAVKMLLDVPDYRGREETLPLLAQAMEPKWAEWWNTFKWTRKSDIIAWRDVTKHVLGDRQFAWLAAQYARSVIDLARPQDRDVCLRAIAAAEALARVPSKQHRQAAESAEAAADAAIEAILDVGFDVSDAISIAAAGDAIEAAAAAARAFFGGAAGDAARAIEAAARAARNANARDDAANALAVLTRRLITPTLVTGAVRGARRNPESKASAKVARLEREVRSAADGRALSISGLKVGRALLVRMSPPLRGAEWVIVSHVRVHGQDEFAFFISDRAGTWPKRLLELHTVRGVRDFKGALEQMGYDLVAR